MEPSVYLVALIGFPYSCALTEPHLVDSLGKRIDTRVRITKAQTRIVNAMFAGAGERHVRICLGLSHSPKPGDPCFFVKLGEKTQVILPGEGINFCYSLALEFDFEEQSPFTLLPRDEFKQALCDTAMRQLAQLPARFTIDCVE